MPFWNLINTVEMGILDLTAILTAVYIFYGFSEWKKRGIIWNITNGQWTNLINNKVHCPPCCGLSNLKL